MLAGSEAGLSLPSPGHGNIWPYHRGARLITGIGELRKDRGT